MHQVTGFHVAHTLATHTYTYSDYIVFITCNR